MNTEGTSPAASDSESRADLPPVPNTYGRCDDRRFLRPQAYYNGSVARDHARMQMGHVYNTYNAPVQQSTGAILAPQMPTGRDVEAFKDICRSLQFADMDDRRITIGDAHPKTCQWLFEREEYKSWRDCNDWETHNGFLWVKGKPGAGKSILMKSAFAHGLKSYKDDVIVSFFFNARGDVLQKSAQGMYRSLIHQLLKKMPNLIPILLESSELVGTRVWPLERLKAMFRDIVLQLDTVSLTCYVDALDECNDEEAQDTIEFLESLNTMAADRHMPFHVLVSSRHYPHIMIQNCIGLDLDEQAEHMVDIERYIESKLLIGCSPDVLEVKADMLERSSGIFLWVVLVIRIMNRAKARGDIRHIKSCLVGLPLDLHRLFDEILRRDSGDETDKESLLLTFQWLLFSERPLLREELYFAIVTSQYEGDIEAWNPKEVTRGDMERFILHSSRGLAELTKTKRPTVQFIHESVRDYLRDSGLKSVYPDLAQNMRGLCHERLKICCHDYLTRSVPTLLRSPDAGLKYRFAAQTGNVPTDNFTNTGVLGTHPFLHYALEGSVCHANAAHSANLTQKEYTLSFPRMQWIRLHNLITPDYDHCLSTSASPAYIFTINGAHNLVEILSRDINAVPAWDRNLAQEYYPSLLDAAVSLSHNEIIDLLIERGSSIDSAKRHTSYLSRAIQRSDLRSVRSLVTAGCAVATGLGDFRSASGSLVDAVKSKNVDIVKCLLSHEVYMAPWHADLTRAMHWTSVSIGATDRGNAMRHTFAIKLQAMEDAWTYHSASIQSLEDVHLTGALLAACESGRHSLMEVLLERLRDTLIEEIHWDDALHRASANGHTDVVQALLERGARVNGEVGTWNIPIIRAAKHGHLDTVHTLLDRGADPNIADPGGYTAIHLAAAHGHDRVVSELLGYGGDPHARSRRDEDALFMASKSEHAAVVEVILKSGAANPDLIRAPKTAPQQRYDKTISSLLTRGAPETKCLRVAELFDTEPEISKPWESGVVRGGSLAATALANALSSGSGPGRDKRLRMLRENPIASLRATRSSDNRHKAP